MHSEVANSKTGKRSTETRYYLSSQFPCERTDPDWHALVRGHWGGVEIRNHWRRDSLWGEDRSRTRCTAALANLAVLRNTLLVLLPEHYPDRSLPELHELLSASPAAALRLLRA